MRVTAALSAGLAACAIAGLGSKAQPQEASSPPRLLTQEQLPAPKNRFGFPVEGWVKLRYSVLANGTTANVRVVERMPAQMPEQTAVEAAKAWQFSPATSSGTAIDWHNNESVVIFDDESIPPETTPPFSQAYIAVDELIAAQDYERAKQQNERMLMAASRLHEIGLSQMQATVINTRLGDIHGAYDTIRRATDPNVVTLTADELAVALRYRFAIEVRLGRAVDALATYARARALGETPDNDQMAAQAVTIQEALRGDFALTIQGRVDRDAWSHAPSLRTFSIADVDGQVRNIDVECDRRMTTLEFAPDLEWTLPASWGACALFVSAKRGTTFTLYEFE